MSRSFRAEDADEALLPNAESALEAAAEPTAASTAEPAAGSAGVPAPSADSLAVPTVTSPRRRGRPPGSKNRPKPVAADESVAVPGSGAAAPRDLDAGSSGEPSPPVASPRRRGRPPGRAAHPVTPAAARRDRLTVEQIVAVESPREPRLSPDGRRVAYTAEAGGARQIFVLELRSGLARQVTASEHDVGDPQWSADGDWLAFVREKAIWIVGADGARPTLVTDHPAGSRAPQWVPGGRRIAFISRRRGWDQAWVVEAPLPRRGRPPATEARPVARAVTPIGVDVQDLAWSPDGTSIAYVAHRDPDLLTMQVTVVDVATGEERVVAGTGAWETSPSWLRDGSGLLVVSDRDGWFQVVRVSLGNGERTVLTAGSVEHGDYNGAFGLGPLPSPDGTRFVHPVFRDGLVDLVVAPVAGATTVKRGRGRPPKRRSPEVAAGPGTRINPADGVWLAVAWLPDGSGVLAVGETERDPEDFWILPAPERAEPARSALVAARPRRLTRSLPAVVPVRSFVEPERITIRARDGVAVPLTLWRPRAATGKRGGTTVPTVIHVHGGPSWHVLRDFLPFRQLLVQEGFAFLSVDFRGSTGYGRDYRLANRDEWGHADAHDVIDAARWASSQPWSNGKLAMYGGSYGGYLTLCALVEEPGLWTAGVDLYGDSEIADSYRHGDRAGRIDLQRMMGSPEDPEKADLFRRGSPLYRAERIEAPLLILHGRKDRRVVPLMSEKMVEALEIEGKHHEVHWYDDEGHGWERRENRRDSFARILGWLRRYVLEEPPRAER
jgi:dipeptidyl aminopeptidase/acylaminoacyl peptidase